MDVVLLIVTVLSVLVASVMGVLARRASRQEMLRAEARVAVLRAAADDDAAPAAPPLVAAASEPLAEVAMAGGRGPAPWAPARVAAFAAAARPAALQTPRAAAAGPSTTALSDGFLGASEAAAGSSGRQRSLAVAALVLFLAVLGGGYWAVFADRTPAPAGPATTSGAALELVSLRHERRGAKLDVTGLVRNPVGGRSLERLTAVVFLFDRQGGFLSSARANVDYLTLVPGDESPFVISLDAPASVARYRVSFRNDAGVVPHLDRRGQEPVAGLAITAAER